MIARFIAGVAGFILVSMVGAFLFWTAGFNFDHRDPEVGEAVFWVVLFAATGTLAAVVAVMKHQEGQK
jgi:hypothetical protein